jgi:sugar lactone lactonase YvrE
MTNYFPQMRRPAFGLLLALLLTACDSGDDAEPAASTPPVNPPASSVDNGTTPPAGNPSLAVASISTTLRRPDGSVLSGNSVDAGDNVIFSASFIGSEPSDYQWYRNGVAIQGANADSYEIGQISSADDQALFSVRVSSSDNSTGTLSQPVSLTVRPGKGIELLAGWQGGRGQVDGLGVTARFDHPEGLTLDTAGNLYVADSDNTVIRKITPNGMVSTLAGSAGQSGYVDGQGAAARFSGISGVSSDTAGNVYVADGSAIRKITPAGRVTTLAGSGDNRGYVNGNGKVARFNSTNGLCSDGAGNLYTADSQTVRKISPNGEVNTVAGKANEQGFNGGAGSDARFYSPRVQACDANGNVYLNDATPGAWPGEFKSFVRKIDAQGAVTTLNEIGTKILQINGMDPYIYNLGSTTMAIGSNGNLYIASALWTGIYTASTTGAVTRLIGRKNSYENGKKAGVFSPMGIAVAANGTIYVTDREDSIIRTITPAGMVATFAGSPIRFVGELSNMPATFEGAEAIATDKQGNTYVTDAEHHIVRKITPNGVTTTLAGQARQTGYADGASALFNIPRGITTDGASNVYVADTANHVIRKITPAGIVSTLAGRAGSAGSADGTGDAARFNIPVGLANDTAGNLYVAESGGTIRKITPAGVVSTRATLSDIQASSLASDASGNLYAARRHVIIKLTTDGQLIGLAGTVDNVGSKDGPASEALFNDIHSITLDPAGNLYVSENSNHTIRKLSPAGMVTTFAGKSGVKGVKLGSLPGGLSGPGGIAFGLRHSQPALFAINWHQYTTSPFKGYTPTETNIVTIALP